MKKILISASCGISILIIIFCIFIILYINGIKSVSKNNDLIEFTAKEGSKFYTISGDLYDLGLIKSEFWYKIYLKLNKAPKIKKGKYYLSKNMSVKDIVDTLSNSKPNELGIKITFKEGYNFNDIISEITANTNNTEEDIMNLIHDEEYINSLINDYWFITDDIKNQDIYYSLEGYLYPDTYIYKDESVEVKEIFKLMLDEMGKKLNSLKEDIDTSKYSVHEILTLASIVELEGQSLEDRMMIAGVFENRLKANMNLGSDVTTYYGSKVRLSERDLNSTELQSVNGYNTRSASLIGKLPVGPICNPSVDSIKAVLNPTESDYYYFVADINHKTYFTKTPTEHSNKIAELKKDGLWYTYE